MCDCKVGPGKFEGESCLTFLAYQSGLLGCMDATTGEEGSLTDWYRAPFNFDADPEAVAAALDYGYCEECISEALADGSAGISIWESDQGFVYGTTYATREEFDKALDEAESQDQESEDFEDA